MVENYHTSKKYNGLNCLYLNAPNIIIWCSSLLDIELNSGGLYNASTKQLMLNDFIICTGA